MKLHCITICSLILGLGLPAFGADILSSEKDRISYGIGMDIGRNITNRQVDINPDALAAGLKAIISGTQPLLTDQQYREAMTALQTQLQAKQADRMKQMEARNKEQNDKTKKEGEVFLAANKTKDGVVTTPSGLQYKVVVMGTGPKPTLNDTVIAHYRGTLINGTEFDSSYKRGEPTEFAVTKVIKGWTEALQLMPTGSKWQLFIPSQLAYGETGSRPKIGPNATLLFDLELISIKAQDAKTDKPKAEKAK